MDHSEKEIRKIVEGCVKNNRSCQESLYKKHYGKMLGVCMRYGNSRDEAKDILHDGFMKVFSSINKYNFKGSLEGWVRRVIVNSAIDYLRKNRCVSTLEQRMENEESYEEWKEESIGEGESGEIRIDDILAAVQKLSPAYRAVFNLHVMDGYSHKEIAEMTGISEGTSKSNLAKAKMNLQRILGKLYSAQYE